jgi:hypothetical protein
MTKGRSILAVSVTGVAALTLAIGAAVASEKHPKYSGSALANYHGFFAKADPRSGSLARVRVRFDSGVRVRLTSSPRSRTYAAYHVVFGAQQPQQELFGFFMIPTGPLGRHVALQTVRDAKAQTSSDLAPLHAALTTGDRPVITITGFPADTTHMDVTTGGTGKAATTVTGPCRNHRKYVRGSMLITLQDGIDLPGLVDEYLLCRLGSGVMQEGS